MATVPSEGYLVRQRNLLLLVLYELSTVYVFASQRAVVICKDSDCAGLVHGQTELVLIFLGALFIVMYTCLAPTLNFPTSKRRALLLYDANNRRLLLAFQDQVYGLWHETALLLPRYEAKWCHG